MDHLKDLFEEYNELPTNILNLMDKHLVESSLSYEECEQFLKEANAIGYTFEYGLDGVPYNLQKI